MKIYLIYCFSMLLAASCRPEQPLPIDPDPKDTTTTPVDSTFRLRFKTPFPALPSGSILSDLILVHQGNPIQASLTSGNCPITCFDGTTGAVKWQWAEFYGDCIGTGQLVLDGGYLVACYNGKRVAVIDANTGKTVWKTEISGNNALQVSAFDGYVYYTLQKYPSQAFAYVVRSPVQHLAWDTLYTVPTQDGFPPCIEGASFWVNLTSGDTLMFFQNRTGATLPSAGWKDMVEQYALNLRTRKVEWKLTNFTSGNITSVRPAFVHQNSLFIAGLGDITCAKAETGEILWQRAVNQDGVTENLAGTDIVFWDDRMAFAPGNTILHCWNTQTGATIWKNKSAGQAFEMTYYDGKIWYGLGKGIFSGNTGERLFLENTIQAGTITVDSTNSMLFGCDGSNMLGYKYVP